MPATRLARSSAPPKRRGTSPTVLKLRKQLATTRKSAKSRLKKAKAGHALTAVLTGAAAGVLARKEIDLPFAGEIGTAGVVAVVAGAAGYYMRSDRLIDVAATMAAIAAHEFVEDSPSLSFLD